MRPQIGNDDRDDDDGDSYEGNPKNAIFFGNITPPLDLVLLKKVSIFETQSCMVLLELHEFWCSFTKETKPLNKRGVGQVKMVGFLNLAQLACFGQLALGGDS